MELRGPKPKRGEVQWSPELAYAVGLIATDGCLYNDGRHIALVSKDIEQLENLKKVLNLKVKVGTHQGNPKIPHTQSYRVQWGDVRFYRFLLSIGLTPNKSLTIGALSIPDEYFFAFLRGAFDGDGSFYSYFDPRWKSSFMFYANFTSASPRHIVWLQETLQRLCSVTGHVSRSHRDGTSGISTLRFAKREALVVLNRMYDGIPTSVHLKRKRLKIQRALRIVGKSLSSARTKL